MKIKQAAISLSLVVGLYGLFSIATAYNDQPVPKAVPVAPARVIQPTITHPDILTVHQLVNDERVKAGLEPLVLDDRLVASSQQKCSRMVELNEWAHALSDGSNAFTDINRRYPVYREAGENLAEGFDKSNNLVVAWMNSPSHKDNIVKPGYERVGYALCHSSRYQDMIVQHFVDL